MLDLTLEKEIMPMSTIILACSFLTDNIRVAQENCTRITRKSF